MKAERIACLIAGRNLGDIVIANGLLRYLVEHNYAEHYLVWTRPHMAFMFQELPNCEVVCSPFPIGTRKEFDFPGILAWLRAAKYIRSRRPSVSLDFVGDLRERIFARTIGSGRHIHIGWAQYHPFHNLIRNPLGQGTPLVTVPKTVPNVYEACELMLRELVDNRGPWGSPWASKADDKTFRELKSYHIGLHPFASQASKLWPRERWLSLARQLLANGCILTAFSAPGERNHLEEIFSELSSSMIMISGTIQEFFNAVSRLDLLIGLDSFSVHLAQRAGVRSIMINAGSPPELWRVPSGVTLAASGGCKRYPCYNVAPCLGTNYENVCINAIAVSDVLAAIEKMRRGA